MANRWGNSGNSDRLYFLGLQNQCRQWLQLWNLCSCLGNPMDRGASWTVVHGVAKSQTWLSNWAHKHRAEVKGETRFQIKWNAQYNLIIGVSLTLETLEHWKKWPMGVTVTLFTVAITWSNLCVALKVMVHIYIQYRGILLRYKKKDACKKSYDKPRQTGLLFRQT